MVCNAKDNESRRLNPNYSFVRSLQLEGTPLAEQEKGVSLYTAARVAKMFGNVTRDIWPYDPTTWPPIEPEDLDKKAAPYRIHHYLRVRNEREIKGTLANRTPVLLSVPYFAQWGSTANGVIEFPCQNEIPIGMHAVLVIGYRDDNQYFHFQNSWGTKWGDNGFGWLPYGYFDRYGVEAVALSELTAQYVPQRFLERSRGIEINEWGLPTPFRTVIHGVTIFDHDQREEVAWAFAFEESETLDVEEFFVSPLYRKRGFARMLMQSLNHLSISVSRPLRYWLPHIDNLLLGQDIHDLAWNFNLRVEESSVNWAAKILVPRTVRAPVKSK